MASVQPVLQWAGWYPLPRGGTMQSEEWCQVRGVAITPDQGANDRWAVGCILEANHEGSHDAFNGALSVVTVVWEGV